MHEYAQIRLYGFCFAFPNSNLLSKGNIDNEKTLFDFFYII